MGDFIDGIIPSFSFIIKQRSQGKNFIYEFYFKGKRTIDVGCGEGEFLRLDKEGKMAGIDVNKRAIEALKAEGLEVMLGTAEGMPYKDGEFEMAHCHNVIEHLTIEQALGMIRETGRIIKKGGYLVLSSEMVTKRFWDTFGHVKPYPPQAIIKAMKKQTREGFDGFGEIFELAGVFYIGNYYANKVMYFISFCLGYFTPFFRREYFVILRKI